MVETRRLGGLSAMEIQDTPFRKLQKATVLNFQPKIKLNTSINLFTTETCPARDGRLFFESG